MDTYWKVIGNLRDDKGTLKYPQLFSLVKSVLSLSHGNSTPERGFSINKLLLEAHGYTIYEDTIIALRTVKDELNRVGGVLKFDINRDLIRESKSAYSKYETDRITRKTIENAEKAKRKEKEESVTRQALKSKEIELINVEIEKCKSSLKVADDIIDNAKENLQDALGKKNVDRVLTQQALSKIEIGTERKRKFQNDLDSLINKKKKLNED